MNRSAVEHPDRRLAPLPAGGFRLESQGSGAIEVLPESPGWRLAGDDAPAGWTLERAEPQAGGFVLQDAEAGEVGRTTPIDRLGGGAKVYYLLLGDGRLFRIAPGEPREGGFELSGWETPGPFLVARPRPDGWSIVPTPACSGLADIRALSILFAAEILDAEGALGE